MKVAIFSDVQGNLPAMEVVIDDILAWQPDLVVMNGDLVNRGPNSIECLRLFNTLAAERGWLPISGNHEHYVLECHTPETNPIEAEMRCFADWACRQIGEEAHSMLGWPDHLTFAADNRHWVHVTHGTLAGNRNGISQSISDEQLEGKIPPDIALFVTAHTHKPLQREFQGMNILNVGSVGSPFDGDVRASYGRLMFDGLQWQTEIIRLDYDRDQAERNYHETGFLAEAGPLAQIIYREWKQATLLMPHWKRQYREPVLQGQISLNNAVSHFLTDLD
jgi:predicted phosphodiesterase